jgi:hypothetical protein
MKQENNYSTMKENKGEQKRVHKFPKHDTPRLDLIMVELSDTFGAYALEIHDKIVKIMQEKNIPLENEEVRWMLCKMAIETNKLYSYTEI